MAVKALDGKREYQGSGIRRRRRGWTHDQTFDLTKILRGSQRQLLLWCPQPFRDVIDVLAFPRKVPRTLRAVLGERELTEVVYSFFKHRGPAIDGSCRSWSDST